MSAPDVVIIDYGLGNLFSVRRGFEHFGAIVANSSDPETIQSAKRVVLPGVGAFKNGMDELHRLGLVDAIRQVAFRGTPMLCICLGMQMLLNESEEFGKCSGLGLIPGRVAPIPSVNPDGSLRKIPHIGWNELVYADKRTDWDATPLSDVSPGESVYFVHSYMAVPENPGHRIADCDYAGTRISAAIAKDGIFGCQFHPEKSGEVGLRILKRFLAC